MARPTDFDRDTVIQKAQEVFWTKGYNGTSMQDLVDATQLNRSSIYNSFGSKHDLFQETLKDYAKDFDKVMAAIRAEDLNGYDTIEQLYLFLLAQIQMDSCNKGCMLINCKTELANEDEKLGRFLDKNLNQVAISFKDLVTQGQADGSINKGLNPEQTAYYLTSVFHGMRITGLYNKDRKILKGIIKNAMITLT